MENVNYKLKEPIQFGSERIETLEFKPLKAKHMRKVTGKNEVLDFLIMAQASCGLTTEEFDEISHPDLIAIRKIVDGFLIGSQETGSKP